MDNDLREQVQAKLLEARIEWERLLGSIQADRQRENVPLDPDLGEQAVQRENVPNLDAPDVRGRQELETIESALRRIASAAFGRCIRCGEAISPDRLRAQPTAVTCLPCARQDAAT